MAEWIKLIPQQNGFDKLVRVTDEWHGEPEIQGTPGNFTAKTPPDGERRTVQEAITQFRTVIWARYQGLKYILADRVNISWHDVTRGGNIPKTGDISINIKSRNNN